MMARPGSRPGGTATSSQTAVPRPSRAHAVAFQGSVSHDPLHSFNGSMSEFVNAFTVDVEDYFQVSAFDGAVRRDQWDLYDTRVEANTRRLLGLLDRHGVAATFFVLGWVARKCPDLVREIHDCGHEIGCHGYWHRLVYEQSPEEFRAELRQSRDVLADLVGHPIAAYRAPSFSITERSLWAIDILTEEGFQIDSSVFPIRHDRYGMPQADPAVHQIRTPSGPIWELPPAVTRLGPLRLPVGGGGYFRLYPVGLTLRLLSKINRKYRRPFAFYVHPWEVDPDQPRIATRCRLARARHYVNLATTEKKLDRLLGSFRFGPVREVVRRACPAAAVEAAPGPMRIGT